VDGKSLSPREEEILAQGANWKHDVGNTFYVYNVSRYLGAIHSSDLERLFQIEKWLKEPEMQALSKKQKYESICSRFIDSAPDEDVRAEIGKAMTVNNAEKYVYVIESFHNCPEAWKALYDHYNRLGEESKMKMNAMYQKEFRTLNDLDKKLVIEAMEHPSMKSAGNSIIIQQFM
jgi:hypothetical protein